MNRYRFGLLTVILLIASFSIVQAQNITLEYGDTIRDELSTQTDVIAYTFDGSTGDALVIELMPDEQRGNQEKAHITLTNSRGQELASTQDQFSNFGVYDSAYLAIVLAADDTYIIKVNQTASGAENPVGRFTLSLIAPEALAPNMSVSGTVSSTSGYAYYVTDGGRTPFNVFYQKQGGDYWPEISVNILDSRSGAITGLGYLTGDEMTIGALGTYRAGRVYFIAVGAPTSPLTTSKFYLDEATANFQIEIRPAN